jgi:hypothetical protein
LGGGRLLTVAASLILSFTYFFSVWAAAGFVLAGLAALSSARSGLMAMAEAMRVFLMVGFWDVVVVREDHRNDT